MPTTYTNLFVSLSHPPIPLSLSLSPSNGYCIHVATFTVMSYNILCDKYATRAMYGYCPSWALSWEYRRQAILKEIIDSMADIVSLQVREYDILYCTCLWLC